MDSYSWWIVEVKVQWETSSQNLKCKESGNRERHWTSLCPPADAHKHLLFSFSPSSHPRHTHAHRNERKGRVLCILPWMLIRNKRIRETGVYLIGLTVAFYSGKAVQRRWSGDPTIPASAPTVCKEEEHADKQSYRFAFLWKISHFTFHSYCVFLLQAEGICDITKEWQVKYFNTQNYWKYWACSNMPLHDRHLDIKRMIGDASPRQPLFSQWPLEAPFTAGLSNGLGQLMHPWDMRRLPRHLILSFL